MALSDLFVGNTFTADVQSIADGYLVVLIDGVYVPSPDDFSEPEQLEYVVPDREQLVYFLPDWESGRIYAVNDTAIALTPTFPTRPDLLDEVEAPPSET